VRNLIVHVCNFIKVEPTLHRKPCKRAVALDNDFSANCNVFYNKCSGAETNLKVGDTGSERKWGTSIRREAPTNFFLVVSLHFLALKVQIVVLVSAFVLVSTVWSVSCLLFFYSRCPRAQPFVKVGGGTAPVPHGVGATERV